ncbi:MAG: glutamate--tRNA ligase [Mycoplasma sp.]|nr:glutamate--tRNA ligase [Candidatus Hennigella equi]
MRVRARYAPSPTGFFHVGGARTALFNYLYAKHMGGDFILRIEDTDTERNVEGGIESQINNLEWMGIKIDESVKNPGKFGPYQQTQKLKRYQELAFKLLEEGKAYRCFCTKEELDKNRNAAMSGGQTPKYNRHCLYLTKEEIQAKLDAKTPFTIRLKIEDNTEYSWDDMIRGKVSVPTSALTDPVILKSNGIPMYNFGVVVDDHDMQITHVLRGEEHISNTPYQIAIKNALGWKDDPIQYGHLSVIVNESGKKLSKRDKSLKQFIQDYQDMGFLPEAIDNFLALLGWAPTNNKEIMSMDEMISNFDIKKVSKAPTFFDFKKMLWVGNKYFVAIDENKYLNFVNKFVKVDFANFANRKNDIILMFKKQIAYAQELNDLITNTFFKPMDSSKEFRMKLANDVWQKTLHAFSEQIGKSKDEISFDEAKQIIDLTKTLSGNKGQDLFMPIRLAITGSEHGPELNKIISILGKQLIKERLSKVLLYK